MSMIKEYFSLLKQYKEKYGVHTLLFMQVGSFFEVYSKSMEDVDMVHFTTICDLKIANKPLGKDKLYMAGFRDYMIDKGYKDIFVSGIDLNNSFMVMGEK